MVSLYSRLYHYNQNAIGDRTIGFILHHNICGSIMLHQTHFAAQTMHKSSIYNYKFAY